MQAVWRSVRWVSGKLLFFLLLLVSTLFLIRMPYLLYGPRDQMPRLAVDAWLKAVWKSIVSIVQGHLVPLVTSPEQVRFWRVTLAEIRPELVVTLKLVGSALVFGMAAGLTIGWLMSRLGPRRLRGVAWGATTLLGCVPDLLVATAFDLGLILVGRSLGFQLYASDVAFYQKYIGPVLALSILIVPYIARVTSAAIAEISGQLYVRTALAKGVPLGRVNVKHVGKNVMVKVWTVLPVVMGILLSGTVMVEYMTDAHGLGRGLVLLLAPLPHLGYYDPYGALLKLLPLLAIMTLVIALSEAGLRWLDPRMQAQESGGGHARLGRSAGPWRFRSLGAGLRRLPGALWQTLTELPARLGLWLADLPGRLLAALKALRDPFLLLGTLLVGGLFLIAILAPRLAPYPMGKTFTAFQDSAGKIWAPPFGPGNANHLLGTDGAGHDVFSQLIYGTRYALLLACLVVPARFLLALLLGLAAAWWGGFWAKLVRWLGVFFTAVPQVIVPLVALYVFNLAYANNRPVCVAWGIFWVALPAVPRLSSSIKQMTQTVLASPFLESAVAAGAGSGRILFRHVLPQLTPQLVTMMALEVPQAMTMTAALAYFRTVPGGWIYDDEVRGVPYLPEWGSNMEVPLMILLTKRWWLWVPFGALFVAVLAFNLLGEGLRRRLTRSTEWQLGSQ